MEWDKTTRRWRQILGARAMGKGGRGTGGGEKGKGVEEKGEGRRGEEMRVRDEG